MNPFVLKFCIDNFQLIAIVQFYDNNVFVSNVGRYRIFVDVLAKINKTIAQNV